MKLEARQVAILRHPKTGAKVGKLYLWETGPIDNAVVEPLSNEDLSLTDWMTWSPWNSRL